MSRQSIAHDIWKNVDLPLSEYGARLQAWHTIGGCLNQLEVVNKF